MDINDIILSFEEKEKILKKSPNRIPLNPSSQGWSGQQVRKFLFQATFDEEGSIIASLEEKLALIKEFFVKVFGDKSLNIQEQIDMLFNQVSTGFIVFEDIEEADTSEMKEGSYAFVKMP